MKWKNKLLNVLSRTVIKSESEEAPAEETSQPPQTQPGNDAALEPPSEPRIQPSDIKQIEENTYQFPGRVDSSMVSLQRQIAPLRPHYIDPAAARAQLARQRAWAEKKAERDANLAQPPQSLPLETPASPQQRGDDFPQPQTPQTKEAAAAGAQASEARGRSIEDLFANLPTLNNCAMSKWTWWVLVHAWVRERGPKIVVDDLAKASGKDRKVVNDYLMILDKAGVIKIDKSKDERGPRRMVISRTIELKLNGQWGTKTLFD